jgi:hypothetical protein
MLCGLEIKLTEALASWSGGSRRRPIWLTLFHGESMPQ